MIRRSYLLEKWNAMSRNVTLRQVAEHAQVAPITVSRVLNNSGYVSPDKRQRVLRAVDELNYTVHAAAKELASQSGRARMLAIVLPHLDNPFFVRVLEGSQAVADEFGYDLLIYSSRGRAANDRRALDALMRRRVEGLIYAPELNRDGDLLVDVLAKLSIPLVFVEAGVPGVDADEVVVDNENAGYTATRHLIEQGYQRIALIASQPDLKQDQDRWQGYCRAIAESGLESLEYFIPPEQRKKLAGQQLVSEMLRLRHPPDAIFAASTLITIGVFQGLKQNGVRLPQQMGLIGYGETEWTSLLAPSLSVVARPAEEIGQQAARLLFKRIDEPNKGERRQIVLPVTLLLRESSLLKNHHD
jgi:DNA-binding LacI/PurR family transcriptional regulator